MSGVNFIGSPPEQSYVHNALHPAPWHGIFLRNRCKQINSTVGYRTLEYGQLLEKIKQADSSTRLRENFRFILDQIPKELLKRPQIYEMVRELITRFYLDEVKKIESASRIQRRQEELSEIGEKCPPELNEVHQKCDKFCFEKECLLSFREESQRTYRVLSIDGGGIRGIIPAMLLVEIEKITGEPISNLFDLIGGTSTGGILGLGLAKEGEPFSAQDLLEFYTGQHGRIFQPNPDYQAQDTSSMGMGERVAHELVNPKYLAPDEFFEEKLEGATLNGCKTDVLITTNSQEAVMSKAMSVAMSGLSLLGAIFTGGNTVLSHDAVARKVHYFTREGLKEISYRNVDVNKHGRYSYPPQKVSSDRDFTVRVESAENFSLQDVARFTSAAPFYFPPIQHENTQYTDGGILQNDPTIPCVLDSLNRGHSADDIFLVSLGTGEAKEKGISNDLKSNFVSMWFDTVQGDVENFDTAMSRLNPGGFHRFQYRFDREAPELDDTRPETIAFLQECGRKLIEQNADYLEEVCKVLKSQI